jgi:hypothetical protein
MGGAASRVMLWMLAQPMMAPASSTPLPHVAPVSTDPVAPVEPPASETSTSPATPAAPETLGHPHRDREPVPMYAPLSIKSMPVAPPAPAWQPAPEPSGDGMLITGALLAGACAGALPFLVGQAREQALCECNPENPLCGCGWKRFSVGMGMIAAIAPTLPLLWLGSYHRGHSDVRRGFAAPKGLRALGWSLLGVGVAFAVTGGVMLSRYRIESPVGTVYGSPFIGAAYAATAAGSGLLFYTLGRRRELKVAAGGGLTLWF